MQVRCPNCKKTVKFGEPEFPFCSERCRMFDLAAWSSEEIRIPGEPLHLADEDDSRD
ncbi:MAG: DNA gyrase inhibitor YacG [Bryobacteraceae bacterium]|nr:DNA gyrase inhibitor YacG [Bryobacteraceae bacterium]